MFDVHIFAYWVRKLFLLFPSSSIFAQRAPYPFFVNRDVFFKTWQIMSLTLLRVKMYSYKDTIVGASLFSRLIWIIKFQGCLDVPVRVFNR